MEHNFVVPAINNMRKDDCLFPNPAKFDLDLYAVLKRIWGSIGALDAWGSIDSAEAICSELPHLCNQSSPQVVVTVYSLMKGQV